MGLIKVYVILFFAFLFASLKLSAHPMPYSVLLLDIKGNGVYAELQWPLKELQMVFPDEDIDSGYATLINRKGDWLDDYLLKHMTITDSSGHEWTITINGKTIKEDEQNYTGKYHELVFDLWMQPPVGASPRYFIIYYDAIMHQLVTHKLFIKIRQDWDGGLTDKDSLDAELGVLGVNFTDNSIQPVIVKLDGGNKWVGFKTMVNLGIEHIAEGTDHLLFLLVLLLPAPLIAEKKQWGGFGGTKYSIFRLMKIVTAFTIGHSLSLLLGAMKWLVLPQQPVEIAIAFTILITAIHAIRPLFFGKEIFIAGSFGLIHGLAFATALSELDVDIWRMILSVLGFNIGIELMQMFVVVCTVPWLILLSKTKFYKILQIGGAAFAVLASFGWITERISGHSNMISDLVEEMARQDKWVVLILIILAISSSLAVKLRRE